MSLSAQPKEAALDMHLQYADKYYAAEAAFFANCANSLPSGPVLRGADRRKFKLRFQEFLEQREASLLAIYQAFDMDFERSDIPKALKDEAVQKAHQDYKKKFSYKNPALDDLGLSLADVEERTQPERRPINEQGLPFSPKLSRLHEYGWGRRRPEDFSSDLLSPSRFVVSCFSCSTAAFPLHLENSSSPREEVEVHDHSSDPVRRIPPKIGFQEARERGKAFRKSASALNFATVLHDAISDNPVRERRGAEEYPSQNLRMADACAQRHEGETLHDEGNKRALESNASFPKPVVVGVRGIPCQQQTPTPMHLTALGTRFRPPPQVLIGTVRQE
eukprot:scaffold926_cov248-Pinguiococcus_pyrenoidosus.AAC.22